MATKHFKLSLCGMLLVGAFASTALGQLLTKDVLHAYNGELRTPTVFSSDVPVAGSKNSSIDFTASGGGIVVSNAAFLNIAATNDIMTFALWVKLHDIADSSAFWANATSAPSSMRGFQAHIPWSNGHIYFDTAGCCNAGETRIDDDIANFTGYSGDPGWWTNWHHFAFIKNGATKQVYIDGQIFLDGTGTIPLPTDFTDLRLGTDGAGNGMMHGLMDDFVVYSTALSVAHIGQLFTGTSPTNLAGEVALAYWNFNDAPELQFSGPNWSLGGFSYTVQDFGAAVADTNAMILTLNFTNVTPTSVTKAGALATISYQLPFPPFASGTTQYTALQIKDKSGGNHSTA